MAYNYSKLKKKDEAKKYYELALKYDPHNLDLLIDYITYLESVEIGEALAVYAKVIAVLDKNPHLKVHPEFFNNYAATLIKNRKFAKEDRTEEYLIRAEQENADGDPALTYFVKFNKGILYEEQAQFDKAINEYHSLVTMNPLFQGRLGVLICKIRF